MSDIDPGFAEDPHEPDIDLENYDASNEIPEGTLELAVHGRISKRILTIDVEAGNAKVVVTIPALEAVGGSMELMTIFGSLSQAFQVGMEKALDDALSGDDEAEVTSA